MSAIFKISRFIYAFLFALLTISLLSQNHPSQREFIVMENGKLNPLAKIGVGVDDSQHLRNWLSETVDGLEVQYPGSLQWGVVFLTSGGDAVPPPRDQYAVNLSAYNTLEIEMKGLAGNECVQIGIKDSDDPDNGSEPKTDVLLTPEWKTYSFEINEAFGKRPPNLSRLDKTRIYVLTEFVFPCQSNEAQTIFVRSIKYSR